MQDPISDILDVMIASVYIDIVLSIFDIIAIFATYWC